MLSKKAKLSTLSTIELKVIVAVFAIIIGTFGFVILAGFVSRNSTSHFDMQILKSFRYPGDLARPIGPVWLFEVMRDITSLGGTTMVFLITLFVVGYFILKKQYSML